MYKRTVPSNGVAFILLPTLTSAAVDVVKGLHQLPFCARLNNSTCALSLLVGILWVCVAGLAMPCRPGLGRRWHAVEVCCTPMTRHLRGSGDYHARTSRISRPNHLMCNHVCLRALSRSRSSCL